MWNATHSLWNLLVSNYDWAIKQMKISNLNSYKFKPISKYYWNNLKWIFFMKLNKCLQVPWNQTFCQCILNIEQKMSKCHNIPSQAFIWNYKFLMKVIFVYIHCRTIPFGIWPFNETFCTNNEFWISQIYFRTLN